MSHGPATPARQTNSAACASFRSRFPESSRPRREKSISRSSPSTTTRPYRPSRCWTSLLPRPGRATRRVKYPARSRQDMDTRSKSKGTGAQDRAAPMSASEISVVFFDIGDTLGTAVVSSTQPVRLIEIRLFPFVPALLSGLREQGLRLGIISNTGAEPGKAVDQVLRNAGILKHFEKKLRLYSADVRPHQEQPENLPRRRRPRGPRRRPGALPVRRGKRRGACARGRRRHGGLSRSAADRRAAHCNRKLGDSHGYS